MPNTHPHYLYSDIVNSIKADKAVITAMTGLLDGTIAYATDTNEFGTYSLDTNTWTWVGASVLLYVQDEGVPIGTPSTLNFVGNNVSVSISGSVARVYITGSSSSNVLLDMQTVNYTSQTGTTTVIPGDNTIPQNTEGGQVMAVSITPKSTTSRLEIDVVILGATNPQRALIAALFRDATADAIAVSSFYPPGGDTLFAFPLHASVTAGSTSPTTFKVRIGPHAAGTAYINGTSGGTLFGATIKSSITVREYSA